MVKKWIQDAIKKPGALHKTLGVPADKKFQPKNWKSLPKNLEKWDNVPVWQKL